MAAFLCPGHPWLDATLDLILERHRELLKRGAVLVDDLDDGEQVRVLFYLEHAVQDGRQGRNQEQQVISQRLLQFVEYREDGKLSDAEPAPYLDYRPIRTEEREAVAPWLEADWLSADIENPVIGHAIQTVVPGHVAELRARKLPYVDKVEQEVTARLKKEINFWDRRAEDLKAQERAGKPTRLSSANAAARADELADRLQRRLAELNQERQISALPPVVRGGAIVVPGGLIRQLLVSAEPVETPADALTREEVERLAMQAVLAAERTLGRAPRDVSAQKGLGYGIESKDSQTGALFFIEVKGRWIGKSDVTLTKNEILCSRNEPEKFRLSGDRDRGGRASAPVLAGVWVWRAGLRRNDPHLQFAKITGIRWGAEVIALDKGLYKYKL